MWLRLRQIALVASKLEPIEKQLIDVLGIKVCFRDPGVAHFGLENALFPIGNQLLEVVAPTRDKTAGGRYLDRRGGDGGYMVITQCDEHAPRRQQVEDLGIRVVGKFKTDEFINMQLHPKDTGGSFFEIDEQLGSGAHDTDGPWEPAGANWQSAKATERVSGIAAAEVQCENPEMVSSCWSDIAQIPLQLIDDAITMQLENANVRFVACSDGRPEGLGGIDINTNDADAILKAAAKHDAVSGERQIYLCGLRINLL